MPVRLKITCGKKQSLRFNIFESDISSSLYSILKKHGLLNSADCGGRGICNSCTVLVYKGKLRKISSGAIEEFKSEPALIKSCSYSLTEGGNTEIAIPKNIAIYGSKIRTVGLLSDFLQGNRVSNKYADAPANTVFGLGIDVGTTTVSVLLADLSDGRFVDEVSAVNAQTGYGSDVISRICLCTGDRKKVIILQKSIFFKTLVPLFEDLLDRNNVKFTQVKEIIAAGNTVMMHLLAGVNPSSLGYSPFTPRFIESKIIGPPRIGSKALPENFRMKLLPGMSAFVGADLSSGCYALNIFRRCEKILFIDIGTNGEIVLKNGNSAYASATAAGPVFEGFGLVNGLPAIPGAVSRIEFSSTESFSIKTISDAEPVGICGSGYVDFLAGAVKYEVVNSLGRFVNPEHRQSGFKIADNVIITENDISLIMQAKSAIASGIQILLKNAGITAMELDYIYLSGGFGTALTITSALDIGLLPRIKSDRIRTAGNTSLAGTYLALLDDKAVIEMENYRNTVNIVELNKDPDFENCFIDNLMLNTD